MTPGQRQGVRRIREQRAAELETPPGDDETTELKRLEGGQPEPDFSGESAPPDAQPADAPAPSAQPEPTPPPASEPTPPRPQRRQRR